MEAPEPINPLASFQPGAYEPETRVYPDFRRTQRLPPPPPRPEVTTGVSRRVTDLPPPPPQTLTFPTRMVRRPAYAVIAPVMGPGMVLRVEIPRTPTVLMSRPLPPVEPAGSRAFSQPYTAAQGEIAVLNAIDPVKLDLAAKNKGGYSHSELKIFAEGLQIGKSGPRQELARALKEKMCASGFMGK